MNAGGRLVSFDKSLLLQPVADRKQADKDGDIRQQAPNSHWATFVHGIAPFLTANFGGNDDGQHSQSIADNSQRQRGSQHQTAFPPVAKGNRPVNQSQADG